MIISDFKYKSFSIKFNRPFINSSSTLNERKGFIISITDELGNTALGEASPLPGFSKETFNAAGDDLNGLSHLLKEIETGDDLQSIKEVSDDYILCPSVKFAFEQAMFGLMNKRDKSVFEKLFLKTKTEINVNAVIGMETEENIFSTIERKISDGYSTFKIKIGRDKFSDDINLIKGIRSRFGNNINLRLDANGKWDFEEAKYNLEKLEDFNIEYIEEPCRGIENLAALSEISFIPVAADESLSSIEDAYTIIEESNLSVIIIKPMILGALVENLDLIKQAAVFDKNIIVSSSFETALGSSVLLLLSSLTHHSMAHGLDTSEYFTEYFFTGLHRVMNGTVDFSPLSYLHEYDFDAVC